MSWIIYKDTAGRINYIYEGCDTANPLPGFTREEWAGATPPSIDAAIKPAELIRESLEEIIKRVVKDELAKKGL